MAAALVRAACALVFAAWAGACANETHDPRPILDGLHVGAWRLDDRGRGALPPKFERFELRSTTDGPLPDGVLVDAEGRSHEYRMACNADFFFGPWLVLKGSTTGTGWQDKIWLGCVAPVGDFENIDLLVAFERHADGSLYPHTYERVR